MDQKNQRPEVSPGAALKNIRLGKTEPSYFNNFAQPSKPDTEAITLTAIDCPKFEKCSAPICPLDPEWQSRSHLPGERVCFYLLEFVKPGAEARFQGCTPRELYRVVQDTIQPISTRYAPIQRALKRAKDTGSRMKRPGRVADVG